MTDILMAIVSFYVTFYWLFIEYQLLCFPTTKFISYRGYEKYYLLMNLYENVKLGNSIYSLLSSFKSSVLLQITSNEVAVLLSSSSI